MFFNSLKFPRIIFFCFSFFMSAQTLLAERLFCEEVWGANFAKLLQAKGTFLAFDKETATDAQRLARAQALPEFKDAPLTKLQKELILSAHADVPVIVGKITLPEIRQKLEILDKIDPDTGKVAFSKSQRRALFKAKILGKTQKDAFLTALLANPKDRVGRMAFADWQIENGNDEAGEYIQIQCALEETPDSPDAPNWRKRLAELKGDHERQLTNGLSGMGGLRFVFDGGTVKEVHIERFKLLNEAEVQTFVGFFNNLPHGIDIRIRDAIDGIPQAMTTLGLTLWLSVTIGGSAPAAQTLTRLRDGDEAGRLFYRSSVMSPMIRTTLRTFGQTAKIREVIINQTRAADPRLVAEVTNMMTQP